MNMYKEHITKIYTRAIESVNPYKAVKKAVQRKNSILYVSAGSQKKEYDLSAYKNIYVVGAGKATAPMAQAIEEILGDDLSEGLICVKYGHTAPLKTVETVEAAHPVPDAPGMEGAKQILSILEKASSDDLVISLISGGGSSLLPLPVESVSFEDKITATSLLLECGASIHQMNAVRKHISRSKGGNFARAAAPAEVLNLMISDVVGDNLDVIASGPFVPDRSTFSEALTILESFKLTDKMPESVISHLNDGAAGKIDETPKPGDEYFSRVHNTILVSNFTSLCEAKDAACKLGYNTQILSSFLEGDTGDSVLFHTAIAREIKSSGNPIARPACILTGGENTVVIKGSGMGGRNTEFALRTAIALDGLEDIYAASIATDGTDGPTDAAGAAVDCNTVREAEKAGLDIQEYADNNDSYNFFLKLGTLVKTGPTRTNVMDIHIFLIP